MATHSNRSAVQEFFEQKVGCADPTTFSLYLEKLTAIKLNLADVERLDFCVKSDIASQFERAALTICQAVNELDAGRTMWSAVKLYYAVFYLLRVELHLNGLSLVRCNQIFTAFSKHGSSVTKFKNKGERSDHAIAISLANKNLKDIDILLSSNVDGIDVYNWMKSLRDFVQYKLQKMPEVYEIDVFFPRNQISISDQIKIFIDDKDPYYCFDKDFAALAIPIKRFQLSSHSLKKRSIKLSANFHRSADELCKKGSSASLLRPYFL